MFVTAREVRAQIVLVQLNTERYILPAFFGRGDLESDQTLDVVERHRHK